MHVLFATRTGIIKKTNLSDFDNVRRGGIIAITIEEGDELIEAELTNGSNSIVLVTHEGMSLRFHEDQARPMGRTAVGNWGIRPDAGDFLVAMVVVHPEATLLVAGTNGIGKRTSFEEYREQSRGGKGIITMKTGDKTGGVIGALSVLDTDELMLTTNKGKTVRTRVHEIREAGRNTMGVKLIELAKNEKLQDMAKVVSQGEDEEATAPPPVADAESPDTGEDSSDNTVPPDNEV